MPPCCGTRPAFRLGISDKQRECERVDKREPPEFTRRELGVKELPASHCSLESSVCGPLRRHLDLPLGRRPPMECTNRLRSSTRIGAPVISPADRWGVPNAVGGRRSLRRTNRRWVQKRQVLRTRRPTGLDRSYRLTSHSSPSTRRRPLRLNVARREPRLPESCARFVRGGASPHASRPSPPSAASAARNHWRVCKSPCRRA
jgi:hypothetical protein